MAQGKVLVTSENLGQGETKAVERLLLFVGPATKNIGKILSINTQSDLDDELGVNDSILKTQVDAAIKNADGLFRCVVCPAAADDSMLDVIDKAMENGVNVEGIVVCKPLSTKQDVNDLYAKQQQIENTYHRFLFIVAALPPIDLTDTPQTWSDYTLALKAFSDGVAAHTVGLVPLLHGNDLGAVAGRLCKYSVTVADTPMRTATGPMVGLGIKPVDSAGTLLSSAVTATIDGNRASTTQMYPDYDGVYFGDLNLLDAEGGDYQVIENLRVVNKARRAVRIKAIKLVGNRKLNSTPSSIAWAKRYLMAPLRDMAKRTQIQGEPFPGEIKPPQADAITIVWESKTKVRIYMRVTPYNSPKQIVISIGLDLTTGTVE